MDNTSDTVTVYETYEDAKRERDSKAYPSVGFCPMINNKCYTGCVCYRPPVLSEVRGNKWTIGKPYCTHVLISGGIEVYIRSHHHGPY